MLPKPEYVTAKNNLLINAKNLYNGREEIINAFKNKKYFHLKKKNLMIMMMMMMMMMMILAKGQMMMMKAMMNFTLQKR